MMIKLKPDCTVDKLWDGDIRMTIKGDLSDEILDYISNNPVDYFVIETGEWKKLSLLLLVKEKIQKLKISRDIPSWSLISKLTYLKELNIEGRFKNCTIDFSSLTKLSHLKTYWNNSFNNELKNAINLKALFIINYQGEDFSLIGKIDQLSFLELYNARKLTSLRGIKQLQKLEYFEVNGMPQLSDVCELTKLNRLKSLSLSKCKKEYNYDCLSGVKSLRQLYIGGDMKDLKWVAFLTNLESFSMDCKLEDGRLDFLFDLKSLKLVLYNNKKNFSVKIKDIQTYLEEKGYNQSELRLSRITFANSYDE